jgi:sugar transferase (PEP-CTERM/EpsH1 system associated)
LATLSDEPVSDEARAALAESCEKLAIIPQSPMRRFRMLWSLAMGRTASEGAFYSRPLRRILKGWCGTHRYRACIVSASSMTPYLGMPGLRDLPAIVDMVDVDSQKWHDYAASGRPPKSWLYGLEGRRLRRLESELPGRARAVTLVSDAEAAIYRPFARPGRIEVITNGVDLDYFYPRDEPESGCVFVGALDYWPNVDGICWFCREIWPEIHRRNSAALLSIVGRRPVAAIRRLASCPGVEIIGQVADVRTYYARVAIVVAPLRIARGVQNKLLESLAMKKALVASPTTLAGLKAEPGVHLLKANEPKEWQETILRLLADPPSRKQLGEAGRRFVEEHHHWDRCLEPLGRLLNEVTSASPSSHEVRK